MIIQFLVLTCSYKHKEINGRCVAGIDLNNKKLIRLITHDDTYKGAIPRDYCKVNGDPIEPLDVIEIEMGSKAPDDGAQTENYFIDLPFIKRFIRRASENEIEPYKEKGKIKKIYFYPFETKKPYLDYYAYEDRKYSLSIVKAYNIQSYQPNPSLYPDKWKIKFTVYNYKREPVELTEYSYTGSDHDRYKTGFRIGKGYLIVSIASNPADDGLFYKFVASIIEIKSSDKNITSSNTTSNDYDYDLPF